MHLVPAIETPGFRRLRTAAGWHGSDPGWQGFSFSPAGRKKDHGTFLLSLLKRVSRVVPGWFPTRAPEVFLAGREGDHGTFPFTPDKQVFRAVPGWFPARTPRIFRNERVTDGVSSPSAGPSAGAGGVGGEALGGPSAGDPEGGGYHVPVMGREVVEWMAAGPGKRVIDGTLGGGGHSEMFLQAGAEVLGLDRDPEAIGHATRRLAGYGGRFRSWSGNFADYLGDSGVRREERVDGLLLDLGVSSRQLDEAARGFSFQRTGPLDMRMGPSSPRTAADVVNGWSEAELVKLLFELGEEPKARRIAAAVVARRAQRPFETTTDLADCIERAVGRAAGRAGRTHPATRSFQAIRIAVNEELDSLRRALEAVPEVLKPGGRLLVITFHSLEDRIVKRFLQGRSAEWLDDPTWPEPKRNPLCQFRLPVRKALVAGADETSINPRSRSAKLRVAERLEDLP